MGESSVRGQMIDVLLASANYMALDRKQVRKQKPYPPLATLYAAAHLREAGIAVDVFDATLAADERAFDAHLARVRPRVVCLFEDNFNFLSKMCLSRMREAATAMARASRAAGALVIAAGSDVTDRPHLYLGDAVDYALLGEPDHALREVIDIALGRVAGDIAEVAGVAVHDRHSDGGVRVAAGRPPERRPDVFPRPAWDLVDIDAYRAVWTAAHGHFSLNLVTTRGCPFHCNWCAKPIWGQRYAMHTPARIADDVAHVKAHYAPDHIWFADDIFGLRPEWVLEFAHELDARDARVPFTIQTRADLLTPAAVDALARAGCVEAWLGAESGSQAILDAMDKGTRLGDIAEARDRLRAAGIRAAFFLQFGYPGETFADIEATRRMVVDLLPDDIGVSVTYPLPGTRLFERVRREIRGKTNWCDSDDLSMMFLGTYDSSFYRELHALLHRELVVRLAESRGEPGTAPEREDVERTWARLADTESTFRNREPVVLSAQAASPRPDLSGAWN